MGRIVERVSPEELARLIDKAGESNWYRLKQFEQNSYSSPISWGVLVSIVLAVIIGVFSGWLLGLLFFGSVLAGLIFVWQEWIFTRGKAEDAMVLASEEDIARAISLTQFEDIGYDVAERASRRGRPELHSFQVLRSYEPENIEHAHLAMKDPVVSKKLREVHDEHVYIQNSSAAWGVATAILIGVIEFYLVQQYWPYLLSDEHKRGTKRIFFMLAAGIGAIVYFYLYYRRGNRHEQLKGLNSRAIREVRREAKRDRLNMKKQNPQAKRKKPGDRKDRNG